MSAIDDLILTKRAESGDSTAKNAISAIVDPIARAQAAKYCRRFCGKNRTQYFCTVDPKRGLQSSTALRCEWGSFSYYFFFEALAKPKTLANYEARNGASLADYLRSVAGSVALWERWKNQRFERRVHVVQSIEKLGAHAKSVYFSLRDGDTIPNIAQRLNQPEAKIAYLARMIKRILVKERRSYLLANQSDISLSSISVNNNEGDDILTEWEPPSTDPSPEDAEIVRRISAVFSQLHWLEQYIIQAMVIDGTSAETILQALREQGTEIKAGQPISEANVSQIYYIRDKAIARLKKMANL